MSGSSLDREKAQELQAEATSCIRMVGGQQVESELGGGGAVLIDEARQVGRGQITAGFSKGKCAL